MASSVAKTIEIIFAGVDNVSGTLSTIGKNVENFGTNLQDIGRPFADATLKVLALSTAVAAIGVAALKASDDLDFESKKMTASLGLTNQEAEKFEGIAREVYKAGFTEDLTSAFGLVTDAQRRFGDNAEVDIGKVAIQASKLQKVFEVDYDQSLRAVNSLMDNFGISSTDAFDFIVAGFRNGLNGSNDFLDSITEYGVQFKNGGADAGEFYSIMETGFLEGINGTDRAADAFKEFRVRIRDGSKITSDALKSIGIDNEALQKNLNSGETSIIEAFQIIINKINETNDKGVAFRAGVGLLGTQFEEVGEEAVLGLDITKTAIGDLQGAIDKIDTGTLGSEFRSLYRTIRDGFADQEGWDKAKEALKVTFEDMGESFEEALKNVDFSGLEEGLGTLWDEIAEVFKDADLDLTTVEGMKKAIQLLIDSGKSLLDILTGLSKIFAPIGIVMLEAVTYFNGLDTSTKEVVGKVLAFGTALTALGGLLAAGGAVMGGFAALGLILTGPVGIFALAVTAVGTTIAAIKKLAGTQDQVNASIEAAAEGHIVYRGKIVDTQKELNKATNETKWLHSATEDLADAEDISLEVTTNSGEIIPKIESLGKDLKAIPLEKMVDIIVDGKKIGEVSKELLTAFPDKFETEVDLIMNKEKLKRAGGELKEAIPEEKTVDIIVKGRKIGEVSEELMENFPDEFQTEVDILIDQDKLTQAKKELDEAVPKEKTIDVVAKFNKEKAELMVKELAINAKTAQESFKYKAEIDIAGIESSAKIAQAAFEFKAKVDVAEIESAAKVTTAAFDSITAGMQGSVDVLKAFTVAYTGETDKSKLSFIESSIREENSRKDNAAMIQKRLVEAQIEYIKAKVREQNARALAIQHGDSLITIDGSGLKPHLEGIMWEVLEAIQVRANEEGQAALLGLTI